MPKSLRRDHKGNIRAWLSATALGGILALGMTGCEVGPDYQAPQSDLTGFHNAAAVTGRSATPAPPLDAWWTGFNDPALSRLVQQALDQNLDIAVALARVQQARAAASAAGAELLPTADFNAQGTALHQSLDSPLGRLASGTPGYNRDQRLYDVGAAASWEIDLFGGLQRGVEAAEAEAQAADAERLGTRVSVAADVADAYFQVRSYQARLTVANRQIDVNTHLVELVGLRRSHGIATDREAAQAEALLRQATATVPLLTIGLEAELNRLDVLMGAQPGTYSKELAPVGEIASIPAIPATDKPSDLLRRRPDIVAAERRVASASARIGVAVSDYYPKISLSAVLGLDSLGTNHLFSAAAFQPAAAGAIRWRLFDFGKVDAEIASAHGAEAEALARYRLSVLRAAEDVENAFMELTETGRRADELQREVAALKRARELSQKSYSEGVSPLTDVLDADRELLTAEDELALNRADAARAAVHSFRALGGGWSV